MAGPVSTDVGGSTAVVSGGGIGDTSDGGDGGGGGSGDGQEGGGGVGEAPQDVGEVVRVCGGVLILVAILHSDCG